jgi:hypothetical protein
MNSPGYPPHVSTRISAGLSSRAGPSSHRYAPGHHDIIGEDNALSRRDRSHVNNHVPDDFFNGIMSNFGGGFGGGHGFTMPGFGSGFGNFSDSNGGSGGGHFYGSSITYAAGDGGGFCKSTTVRRGPNGVGALLSPTVTLGVVVEHSDRGTAAPRTRKQLLLFTAQIKHEKTKAFQSKPFELNIGQ